MNAIRRHAARRAPRCDRHRWIPEARRRQLGIAAADRRRVCRSRSTSTATTPISTHGQRRGLRHAGARAEHRGRLRRPARPGLRRVLRHRRLYLRHPHRLPGAAGVELVLGAVPVLGLVDADATEVGTGTWCISRCRSGWPCRWRRRWRRSSACCSARPRLRLRGDYLAIVTLGFGEIVPIVVRNWSSLTNGAAGLNGVAAPRLFGWSFGVDADAVLLRRHRAWWRC